MLRLPAPGVVAGLLLPLSSSDFLNSGNRSVTSGTMRHIPSGNNGVPRWGDDNHRSSCRGCIIDSARVVRSVRYEVGEFTVSLTEETGNRCRMVGVTIREHLRHDDARPIDAEMELPPALSPASTVLGRSPFPFADDRQAAAVHHQMKRAPRTLPPKMDVEVSPAARGCRVIRGVKIQVHEAED